MISINARGARTIADAKPLIFDGQGVYVTNDGQNAQLHLGGRVVAERPAAEVAAIVDAQDWAYEMIETANALVAEPVADEAAVAEAVNPAFVYDAAAAAVRQRAAGMLNEIAILTAHGEGDHRRRNARGRMVTVPNTDPRHPARRAEQMRREAFVLANWSAKDEAAYARYVNEGIGDTDGHYAPLDRFGWISGR